MRVKFYLAWLKFLRILAQKSDFKPMKQFYERPTRRHHEKKFDPLYYSCSRVYGPCTFYILQAKREKECDELRRSGDKFIEFLDRADRWLSQNTKKIVELFRRFDQSGEGVVTHDEFKAGRHQFHDVFASQVLDFEHWYLHSQD